MAPFSPQLKVQSAVSCPNLIAERWRHTCFVPYQFEEQQLFVMTKSNTCSRFLGEQKGHHPFPSMGLMSRPWALARQISCRNATMLKNLLSSFCKEKTRSPPHDIPQRPPGYPCISFQMAARTSTELTSQSTNQWLFTGWAVRNCLLQR